MQEFEHYITDAAAFYGLGTAPLRAVLYVESGGTRKPTPRWEPHKNEHSYGLGQILPSTALWMLANPVRFPLPDRLRERTNRAVEDLPTKGEAAFNSLLHDAEVNIFLTAAYLRYQYDRYDGNITDAVAAYNAGSVRKTSTGQYVNQWHVDKFHDALALYA